jgi:hypothetical protein
MLAANPSDHLAMYSVFESASAPDGQITRDEMERNDLFVSLLGSDVDLFDGSEFDPTPDSSSPDSLSIGFEVHLTPCESGRCSTQLPVDPCHDRIRDGDETDVDCGGSCHACSEAAVCVAASDCQTGGCDAGRCRAATCNDGLHDGFESDIDCGGACVLIAHKVCAAGKHCHSNDDCASQVCDSAGETCR